MYGPVLVQRGDGVNFAVICPAVVTSRLLTDRLSGAEWWTSYGSSQ